MQPIWLFFFIKISHTYVKSAIEIDESEHFQDIIFIDILSLLLEKKIHRKENRILTVIYNGVRMFTSFSIRMSLSILRTIFQRDIIRVCCNIKSP